jgi:hypothetical protein
MRYLAAEVARLDEAGLRDVVRAWVEAHPGEAAGTLADLLVAATAFVERHWPDADGMTLVGRAGGQPIALPVTPRRPGVPSCGASPSPA